MLVVDQALLVLVSAPDSNIGGPSAVRNVASLRRWSRYLLSHKVSKASHNK